MNPEQYLNSLEPIGWKLGLDRIHRLTAVLGMPQMRFDSIHVVGTNGKSSVTQMTAALLEAHGVRAGACLSPHLVRWAERVRIHGREVDPDAFAASIARTAEAAELVNRTLEEGDAVTQFEVATAAAFLALAHAGVRVGVIEAGLGGRLDATNVIASSATVLTSIGLDHTEWLGKTLPEIAAEKLAVLRSGSVLVVGRLPDEIMVMARAAASEQGARLIVAPDDPGHDVRLIAPGAFQRRNFSLSCAAAEVLLGGLDPGKVKNVASETVIPGRLQLIAEDPPTYVDVAHNAEGARALAEALVDLSAGRPVVGCLAILAEKDAEAMVAALAPALAHLVCTEISPSALSTSGRPGSRSAAATELAELSEATGTTAEAIGDPAVAMARAVEIARRTGAMVVVAGSHYLLGSAGAGSRA